VQSYKIVTLVPAAVAPFTRRVTPQVTRETVTMCKWRRVGLSQCTRTTRDSYKSQAQAPLQQPYSGNESKRKRSNTKSQAISSSSKSTSSSVQRIGLAPSHSRTICSSSKATTVNSIRRSSRRDSPPFSSSSNTGRRRQLQRQGIIPSRNWSGTFSDPNPNQLNNKCFGGSSSSSSNYCWVSSSSSSSNCCWVSPR
jgi:hypothetical protein